MKIFPFYFGVPLTILLQDVRRGLNSVRKIHREYGVPGVIGPIIELVECDERFFTAVEVTAGNRCVKILILALSYTWV